VAADASPVTLTARELLVLRLMRDHHATEAEVAELLNVSEHTVHAHLRNARSKLGVRSTRLAIRRALD